MSSEDIGASVPDRATHEPSPDGLGHSVSVPSAWPPVEWDDDGYPTGEYDDFAAWDGLKLDFNEAAAFLLRELPECARNCCAACDVTDAADELFGDKPVKRIEFSTGGWSGAESLIGLISNRFDTRHFMLSWRRGGHYVFEIPLHFLAQGMQLRDDAPAAEAEGLQPGPQDAPTPSCILPAITHCNPIGDQRDAGMVERIYAAQESAGEVWSRVPVKRAKPINRGE